MQITFTETFTSTIIPSYYSPYPWYSPALQAVELPVRFTFTSFAWAGDAASLGAYIGGCCIDAGYPVSLPHKVLSAPHGSDVLMLYSSTGFNLSSVWFDPVVVPPLHTPEPAAALLLLAGLAIFSLMKKLKH